MHSRSQKGDTGVPIAIKLIESRMQAYFSRLQSIYDASSNISTSQLQDTFLRSAYNLDQLRTDYLKSIDELNLLKMQNDPEFSPDYNAFLAFEEIYCITQAVVQQLKSYSTPIPTKKSRLNLPPINLKTFDGDLKNWPSFFECFNNAVHNNTNLSKSDKVFYLSGILSKSALTAISDIPPTADNYDLIYSTLVDKYQDIRTLATTYLQQIINLKPLTTTSADGLNIFLDKFAASVCAFDRLNISNKKDFIFLFLALQKLDKETIRNFENSVRSEKLPTCEFLVKFIKEQVKIHLLNKLL